MNRMPFVVPADVDRLGVAKTAGLPVSVPSVSPYPLEDRRLALAGPKLIDALPASSFKVFLQYAAHTLQVSEDMTMLNAIGAVNTAVNGKFEIIRNCGHREPLSLYIVVVEEPGGRKSAVVKLAKQPLHNWLEQRRAQDGQWSHDGKSRPAIRLYFQDTTAAALKRALAETEGRLSCHEPEPGLLDMLARSGAHMSLFCNGYDHEPIVVDRVNKPLLEIPAPAFSLCISAQPEAALRFARNHRVRSCGLLARLLVVRIPSLMGTRRVGLPPIPQHSLDFYNALIRRLLDIPALPTGMARHALELTDNAEALFAGFARWAELELLPCRSLNFDTGWGAKLPGKVLRLAGLLHCIAHDDPRRARIDTDVMGQAICMAHFFAAQTRNFFWHAEHGEVQEVADEIVRWASTYATAGFSVQDVQSCLSRHSRQQIQAAVDLLLRLQVIHEDLMIYAHQQERWRRGRPRAPRFRLAYNYNAGTQR
ncbi:DUF3987 domain-containing protein [Azospirillum soli]|uniref:DUF3987 domain-containing protein n=1 Tax=Azospirillum soli TaxID=1304799 RepID=UPI001AE61EDF|nr:DUF3987 domain-containing protein [Azospirillum soli]MBP2312940.1 hypothetical protein [Azospirillum soli]